MIIKVKTLSEGHKIWKKYFFWAIDVKSNWKNSSFQILRPSRNILTLRYQFIHICNTNYYKNIILFRNDNITEEAVYNEKNSKMSKRHSHGSSKKSSSKQHRHSSHKHRSQSESNNSNGVDALHVDHDQLGGAGNNGSTSCRNFGSGIQT